MNQLEDSKILIVDDEPANIFVLEGFLLANRFKVTTASSGLEALRLMKQELPDLIMLDIMMPGMSGIEVLQTIVNDSEVSDIPVLMVSAKSEAEDIEGALNIGAVDYIPKPFNDVELLARVRASLRLKKQKDALKEMIESKNNFIRIVSHDLRTPFSSISGFADILLNDEELKRKMTSEHKEFLQYIIETSHYLISYFNKLLNWSKYEAGKIELKIGIVKISKLIDTTQMIFQKNMEDKKIAFIRDVPEDIIINADDTYFNQVINNIVSNAIKYTPNGGQITLKAFKEADNTIIEIADSGEGISGQTPEQLFEKPYHRSTVGTMNEKGTGLGLFICKKIIDAHGFGITFRSMPGQGTTFVITCK